MDALILGFLKQQTLWINWMDKRGMGERGVGEEIRDPLQNRQETAGE